MEKTELIFFSDKISSEHIDPVFYLLKPSKISNGGQEQDTVVQEIELKILKEFSILLAVFIKSGKYIELFNSPKYFGTVEKFLKKNKKSIEGKTLTKFWNIVQKANFNENHQNISIEDEVLNIFQAAYVDLAEDKTNLDFCADLIEKLKENSSGKITDEELTLKSAQLFICGFSELFKNMSKEFLASRVNQNQNKDGVNKSEQKYENSSTFDTIDNISEVYNTGMEVLSKIPNVILHKYLLKEITKNSIHFNARRLMQQLIKAGYNDLNVDFTSIFNKSNDKNKHFEQMWNENISEEIEDKIIEDFDNFSLFLSENTDPEINIQEFKISEEVLQFCKKVKNPWVSFYSLFQTSFPLYFFNKNQIQTIENFQKKEKFPKFGEHVNGGDDYPYLNLPGQLTTSLGNLVQFWNNCMVEVLQGINSAVIDESNQVDPTQWLRNKDVVELQYLKFNFYNFCEKFNYLAIELNSKNRKLRFEDKEFSLEIIDQFGDGKNITNNCTVFEQWNMCCVMYPGQARYAVDAVQILKSLKQDQIKNPQISKDTAAFQFLQVTNEESVEQGNMVEMVLYNLEEYLEKFKTEGETNLPDIFEFEQDEDNNQPKIKLYTIPKLSGHQNIDSSERKRLISVKIGDQENLVLLCVNFLDETLGGLVQILVDRLAGNDKDSDQQDFLNQVKSGLQFNQKQVWSEDTDSDSLYKFFRAENIDLEYIESESKHIEYRSNELIKVPLFKLENVAFPQPTTQYSQSKPKEIKLDITNTFKKLKPNLIDSEDEKNKITTNMISPSIISINLNMISSKFDFVQLQDDFRMKGCNWSDDFLMFSVNEVYRIFAVTLNINESSNERGGGKELLFWSQSTKKFVSCDQKIRIGKKKILAAEVCEVYFFKVNDALNQ